MKKFYKFLNCIGFYRPLLFAYRHFVPLLNYFSFLADFVHFKRKEKIHNKRFSFSYCNTYPCLSDKKKISGFDRHYIYHLAWASCIIRQINPPVHVDISSSLHFCTQLSAFIPVEFYDFHKVDLQIPNLKVGQANLTKLAFADHSIPSLSCMHVVEHIGLGRYGDELDYDGDLKAFAELERVLAVGGNLLIVVPVGAPTIMFNAHRIYSVEQILSIFTRLELVEFSLIPETFAEGALVKNPSKDLLDKQTYACGCFWFKKNDL